MSGNKCSSCCCWLLGLLLSVPGAVKHAGEPKLATNEKNHAAPFIQQQRNGSWKHKNPQQQQQQQQETIQVDGINIPPAKVPMWYLSLVLCVFVYSLCAIFNSSSSNFQINSNSWESLGRIWINYCQRPTMWPHRFTDDSGPSEYSKPRHNAHLALISSFRSIIFPLISCPLHQLPGGRGARPGVQRHLPLKRDPIAPSPISLILTSALHSLIKWLDWSNKRCYWLWTLASLFHLSFTSWCGFFVFLFCFVFGDIRWRREEPRGLLGAHLPQQQLRSAISLRCQWLR